MQIIRVPWVVCLTSAFLVLIYAPFASAERVQCARFFEVPPTRSILVSPRDFSENWPKTAVAADGSVYAIARLGETNGWMRVDIRDGRSDRLLRTAFAPQPSWAHRIVVNAHGTHTLIESSHQDRIAILSASSGRTVFETMSLDPGGRIDASFSDGGRYLTVRQGPLVQLYAVGGSHFEQIGFYDLRQLRMPWSISASLATWVHFRERSRTFRLQYMDRTQTALIATPRGQRNLSEDTAPADRPYLLRGIENDLLAQAVAITLGDQSSTIASALGLSLFPLAVAASPTGARFATVAFNNAVDPWVPLLSVWTHDNGVPRNLIRIPTRISDSSILSMPDDETVIVGSEIDGSLIRYRLWPFSRR